MPKWTCINLFLHTGGPDMGTQLPTEFETMEITTKIPVNYPFTIPVLSKHKYVLHPGSATNEPQAWSGPLI